MPILAYNPTLTLAESHVACYKIYALRNPIDDKIFYVGQTCMALAERLNGHLNETGANRDKIHYIKAIIDAGLKPIIQEVETIHTKCYIDKASVNEREAYWIKYYRGIGCTLLNISMPSNYEYRNYLSSLKAGQTQYHYYYCGKTYGGHDVYDERRMNADGFMLADPNPPQKATRCYVNEYNPWQNERFIKKVGYVAENGLAYVPCYNDMNTDFYDEDY